MGDWEWPEDVDFDRKGGEIDFKGTRYITIGAGILPEVLQELKGISGDVAKTIVYNAAFKDGKETVEKALNTKFIDLIRKIGVATDERIIKKVLETKVTEQGYGRGELVKFDKEGTSVVRVHNSFEASQVKKKYGEKDEPVCHDLRGLMAGGATAITKKKMKAKETKCEAMDDEYCEFEISQEE